MHPYRLTGFMSLLGPANDDQVRGTYLAYGISLDLSSDRKVATILGPVALASLIRIAQLVI